MIKWQLVDQRLIVDELNPDNPSVVLIDKSLGKWLVGLMNDARESEKKLALLKEENKELKLKIIALNQKCARRDQKLAEVPSLPKKPRQPSALSGKHPRYADKLCPGAGSRQPHMFPPNCGKQTMCSECRAELNRLKRKMGVAKTTEEAMTIETSWRGSTPFAGLNIKPEPKESSESLLKGATAVTPPAPEPQQPKETRPSVEEVLRMPDGPEKKALESKFTLAEKMEAAKLRYKIDRENMRKMRNRGFDINDPIVGAHGKY